MKVVLFPGRDFGPLQPPETRRSCLFLPSAFPAVFLHCVRSNEALLQRVSGTRCASIRSDPFHRFEASVRRQASQPTGPPQEAH